MNKITIICGTNRIDSVSYQISVIYQQLLAKAGCNAEIIDLTDLPNDFAFTALYENSGKNEEFNHFRKLMSDSDKFVFVVPEYNGSFPGVLKTFIDGLEYPGSFKNKKSALVGISSGIQGAGLALSHLTDIFHYCGMEVLSLKPKLSHIEKNFNGEKITNKLYQLLIEEQVEKILAF
ncbi:NADPH-dependent FMN reductase [Fulvivirga lutimaris]|uniref:NADPH-dependent FMN reductase n=1 Tax=Fulvivirga lutimaris TaxID=1819566 RepID=UPI0012BB659A|nr:NAD(P)H-dependent oxidoreductase [Fulvivirga lutimaris]MTI39356.1 NADPH-dependent oxidoreductase [Fulvivirga lutimaris]